jgi:protoheme IX farnesyltransferase
MISEYFRLTKPGIIFGNVINATASFFLASKGHINFPLLFELLIGTSFIIASACVFNNYLDRGIDAKMARTKKRALVQKLIPVPYALVYGAALGILGILILIFSTNLLTVLAGILAFIFYVFLYTPLKKKSVYAVIVGSVPGAIPAVAGYLAVTGRIDTGAILLFFILVFWQMPHFYSIAIYRLKEYAAANIATLPVKKGVFLTKIQILLYIIAFIVASSLLTFFGFVGSSYLVVMLVLGFSWLILALKGFRAKDDDSWARLMFKMSLIIILCFSVMISIDPI